MTRNLTQRSIALSSRLCAVFLICLMFSLAACGGGAASSSQPSGPNIPLNPAASAVPKFSGNTAQAKLTQDASLNYGMETQQGIDTIATLAILMHEALSPPGGDPTIVNSSSAYGSAQGRFNADKTGWIEGTLSKLAMFPSGNYYLTYDVEAPDLNPLHRALTLSGKGQVVYVSNHDEYPLHYIASYYGVEAVGAGVDVVLNGTIEATLTYYSVQPTNYSGTFTANLSVEDKLAHTSYLLHDFKITTDGSTIVESNVTASGQITDSKLGSVNVSTILAPLTYKYAVSDRGPLNGGYLKFTGAGTPTAYFGSLNYYFASVGFDPTGVGAPTTTQRFSWETDRVDTTPANWTTGPVAYAGVLKPVTRSERGILDGRFSYSPTGGPLTYSWSVELSPPGSNPVFTSPTSATPQLSVDQTGAYLVKLVVSDGLTSSTDRVVLVVPQDEIFIAPTSGILKAGPSTILGQIGQPITLDTRVHNSNVYDFEVPAVPIPNPCYLVPPTGSAAALTYPSRNHPTFTPDINGYYMIYCGDPNQNENHVTVVNVNEPLQFSPPVPLFPNENNFLNVAVADLNGDGKIDLITTDYWAGKVDILVNQGAGKFLTQSVNVLQPGGAAADDFDGDGREDIAVGSPGGVAIFTQQSDGSFKQSQLISPCSSSDLFGTSVIASHLGSDTVGSLLYQGNCSDGIHLLRNDGSGAFSDQGVQSLYPGLVQLADVTGDGINDLVTGSFSSIDPTVSDLVVYPGKTDGSFDTPVDYSLGPNANPNFIGTTLVAQLQMLDIDGDGLTDVSLDVSQKLMTFTQGSGALSSSPTSYSFTSCSLCITKTLGPVVADLDGDGRVDLISESSLHVGGYFVLTTSFKLQDASHNFGAQIDYPEAYWTGQTMDWYRVKVLDLNADGILDLQFDSGYVQLGEPLGQ